MEQPQSNIATVLEIKNGLEDDSLVTISEFDEKSVEGLSKNWNELSSMEKRNLCFEMVVHDQVLNLFDKALKNAGLTDDQIIDFNNNLAEFNSEQINRILAIPFELRNRRLSVLVSYYKNGEDNPAMKFLNEQLETSEENGFALGYHVSSNDFTPKKDREGNMAWEIQPYELDDRVNMKMAYYSRTFDSMYLKKPFKYIYIIRSSDSHRKDNHDKWGYAPFLSVVDRIDMTREQADQLIEGLLPEIEKAASGVNQDAA